VKFLKLFEQDNEHEEFMSKYLKKPERFSDGDPNTRWVRVPYSGGASMDINHTKEIPLIFSQEIDLVPCFLLLNGSQIQVGDEAYGYHDDAVSDHYFDTSLQNVSSSNALVGTTGVIKITMTGSLRHHSDYGGGLGITLSRRPTQAQQVALAKYIRASSYNEQPYFDQISIEVVDQQGKTIDNATFENLGKASMGQILRYFAGMS
jgi:hypothetical protein